MNVYLMPLIFILIIAAIYGLGILAGKAEKWLERKEKEEEDSKHKHA